MIHYWYMLQQLADTIQSFDARLVAQAGDWVAAAEGREALALFLADFLLVIIFVPVLAYLWYEREPRGTCHGNKKAVMLALLTAVFALAAKMVFATVMFRSRPDLAASVISVYGPLDPQSFPSGHVLVAASLSISLYLSGMRRLFWILLPVVLAIAVGRVLLGVHYPTDVTAGFFFGWFIAYFLHHESSSIKRYLPD